MSVSLTISLRVLFRRDKFISEFAMTHPADKTLLERWKLTPQELSEIISQNPSMRGLLMGYVAEYKLRKIWFSDDRVDGAHKYDDHDRSRPSDLEVHYNGVPVTIEVKSLQTASVRQTDGGFVGRFQCDASDRRRVELPNGETLQTTCLVVGQFDLLAVNLFAFREEWDFAFIRNQDLPRSRFRGYTQEQRQYLLATLVDITLPVQRPFESEPFRLLEEIAREKSQPR